MSTFIISSSAITPMVSGLNGLASLNLTFHLSFGQLLHSRSSSLTFTHMLHNRYRSKEDLLEYVVHPKHVRVVKENKPIIDGIMAVDWMFNGASFSPKPGSAIRVTFLKLKGNLGENEKARANLEALDSNSEGVNSHEEKAGDSIKSVVVVDYLIPPPQVANL
ncbi:unnamed protein product [Lactuca saligna]|uniref:Stress-response A/B barrel domain-containing protein n=1 Tax=Lactuca saligna TaxID=75948 RepID=A0AA35VHZ4_LACSI|nr:unnamed protein product [Lactuca saligna]